MAIKKSRIEERHILYVIIKWVMDILVAAGLAVFLTIYMGERITITGFSLEPTLTNGESVLLDKVSYCFQNPKRFDIVAFTVKDTGRISIKRIIGLPGETVQIKEGRIYIDGLFLEEPFGEENILNAGLAAEEIILGEEEYFLLGDNRNNSEDSRFSTVGNIRFSSIMGRLWLRVTTLNDVALLK